MAGTDKEAFAAAMGRVQACYQASRLALQVEEHLTEMKYRGPVAIIGSYVRDLALARDPSSIGVAIDQVFLPVGLPFVLNKLSVPVSFVTHDRIKLTSHGYFPQLTNDRFNQETFLKAVIALEPLRINALGATPSHTLSDPNWDFDAYHNRFVLKYGMSPDLAERPEETLEALTSGRYRDWTIQHELANGDLEAGLPSDSVL